MIAMRYKRIYTAQAMYQSYTQNRASVCYGSFLIAFVYSYYQNQHNRRYNNIYILKSYLKHKVAIYDTTIPLIFYMGYS